MKDGVISTGIKTPTIKKIEGFYCPKCHTNLVWQKDYDYKDVTGNPNHSGYILSCWHCPECDEVFEIIRW